jgi:signal transduction histidine kinase
MNNLHPSILEELGLIATIGWLCVEYLKTYPQITVQKQISVYEEDIARELKIVIYRVLQESLNNFARHGNGNRVDLSLINSDGTLALMIRDNGQGFDLQKTEKGLGLNSMRERIELSGGEFQIESIIGQGTTIRASWSI